MFLRPRGTIFGHRGLYSNRRGKGSQGEGHQNFLRGAAIWPNSRLCLLNSKEIFQHYSAIKTFETRENKLQVQQHIAFFQKEVLTLLIISYYNIFAKRILYGWFKIVYEIEAKWLNYAICCFHWVLLFGWVDGGGEGVAITKGPLIGGHHILVKGAAKAELLGLRGGGWGRKKKNLCPRGGGGAFAWNCTKQQFWGTGTVAGTEGFRNQTTET